MQEIIISEETLAQLKSGELILDKDVTISLDDTPLNVWKQFLSFFQDNKVIQSLKLYGLSEYGFIEALASVLPQTQIKSLDLSDNDIEDKGAKTLANVLCQTQIENLNLSSTKIRAAGIKALANALSQTKIITLKLYDNCIGDDGAMALASILPGKQVADLDMSNNNIGAEGLKALAAILPRTAIKKLNLSYNKIEAEEIKELANILSQTQIESLDLSYNNKIGDEGAKALASVLPQTKMKELGLVFCNLTYNGFIKDFYKGNITCAVAISRNKVEPAVEKVLVGILPQTQVEIEVLDLSRKKIGDEGVKKVANDLLQRKIIHLNLMDNNIGVEGVKVLANILPQTQIVIFNLSYNKIGNEGLKYLTNILPQTQVATLILYSNKIGDDGVRELAGILPQTQVAALYLNRNEIGVEGIKALASVLSQTKIITLKLYDNHIGDDGAMVLASILPETQVADLDLTNSDIGDEGVKALASILSQTRITTLILLNNLSISESGAHALAESIINNYRIISVWMDFSREDAMLVNKTLARNEKIAPFVIALDAFLNYDADLSTKEHNLVVNLASKLSEIKQEFSSDNAKDLFTQTLDLMKSDLLNKLAGWDAQSNHYRETLAKMQQMVVKLENVNYQDMCSFINNKMSFFMSKDIDMLTWGEDNTAEPVAELPTAKLGEVIELE